MDIAERTAEESYSRRSKVGAIIVKNGERIVSIGYNGTPSGWDNNCEKEIWENDWSAPDELAIKELVTKPEVIHAEANAIGKLAKYNESGLDAVMFATHSPCFECAKTISVSGIKTIYYKYDYHSSKEAIALLEKCGINVIKVE